VNQEIDWFLSKSWRNIAVTFSSEWCRNAGLVPFKRGRLLKNMFSWFAM